MPVPPDTLIADRYKLLECLGAGGMGEVWKAQDTNFTRLVVVAVKLLKEDETFVDDARNRANLARTLQREAAGGHFSFELVVSALDEAFNAGVRRDILKTAAEAYFAERPLSVEAALGFFDNLASDSTYNENARHRRRLRDLFATEANSVAVLQHPNIVRVTDYGDQGGLPFLVMDFISGRTLQQVIQRREAMPLTTKLRLMEDLCEGLGYAHGKDLVHRDIKPANLIIDSETDRLKILDFGVARTMQLSAQRSVSMGAPIGTYCYMSPEQTRAARTLDNRSDIFSVGLVFYELLSFQRAFPSGGDISELIGRIQRDAPAPLGDIVPDLDRDIERIVYKAIEKVPAKRYPYLTEMRRDIEVVRSRLEEEQKRQVGTMSGATQLARPRPLLQQVTDLIDRAMSAFDTGDDHAVIEFSDQVLSMMANQPDALELKERARARIKLRLLEASVHEARLLLESGDLTAAGRVLDQPEIDRKVPAVRDLIDDLNRARRAREVGVMIGEARALLEAGALEQARERAGAVLRVDPTSDEARSVHEQAESLLAIERRRREEQLARERAIGQALAQAQDLLQSGAFGQAHEVLQRARDIDPTNAEVVELDGWVEPISSAVTQLEDAIRLFDRDELGAAEAQLRVAADALEAHKAAFPALRKRLNAAERARTSAVGRENERRQRELEEQQRQAALAAEQRVRKEAAERARLEADRARQQAERRRQEEEARQAFERRVDQTIAESEKLFSTGARSQALDALAKFQPAHARITKRLDELTREDARLTALEREREAKLARERAIGDALAEARARIRSGEFAKAREVLAHARDVDASNPDVDTLEGQVTLVITALEQLDQAIALFDRDQSPDAERHFQEAAKTLAGFKADVRSVRDRLASAERARTALIERERVRVREAKQKAEEQRRAAALAERARLAREAEEAKRKAEEEETRRKAEAEQARQAREAEETRRKAEEEEARRKARAEAEEARKTREAEQARRRAEEEKEAKRKAQAEEERNARQVEAERKAREAEAVLRRAEEERRRKSREAEEERVEPLPLVEPAPQVEPSPQIEPSRTAWSKSRVALGAAAVLVISLLGAGGFWYFGRSAPAPAPDTPPAAPRPTIDYAATIRQARESYNQGDSKAAITAALNVPPSAKEYADATALLTTIRTDAEARTVTERRNAEDAGRTGEPVFVRAVTRQEEAQKLIQPADTPKALALYEDASALFRQAAIAGWSADRLMTEAKREYDAKRIDRAVEYALRTIALDARHPGAIGLLRNVRSAASTETINAGRSARDAGATDANSPSFKVARSQQTAAMKLQQPRDTQAALKLFDSARQGYLQAAQAARDEAKRAAEAQRTSDLQRNTDLVQSLQRADERLKAEDLQGATAAITDAERLNPADPRLGDLKKRAEALRVSGLAAQQQRVDIERALAEAAKLSNDNEAIARLQGELAKYAGNAELGNAIARRTKARDERVADLVRRARSAGDAQAVDLLTEALTYNPTRADIREDLERRRAAMGRAPAVARGVMEREVRDTLDAYEAAYAKRNVDDFLRIAPFRTRAQIENEFKNFRSIQLSIENATVAIDDNNLGASVTCTINRVLVPSVSAPPIKDRLTWQLRMTKVDGAWQITSATASR